MASNPRMIAASLVVEIFSLKPKKSRIYQLKHLEHNGLILFNYPGQRIVCCIWIIEHFIYFCYY